MESKAETKAALKRLMTELVMGGKLEPEYYRSVEAYRTAQERIEKRLYLACDKFCAAWRRENGVGD